MSRVQLVVIRNSEIADFRTCRRKWHLRHVEGLQPKRRARALEIGTIAHRGFAAMYAEIGRQQTVDAQASALDIDLVYNAVSVVQEEAIAEWKKRLFGMQEWMSLSEEDQHALVAESEKGEREARAAIVLFVHAFAREDWRRFKVLNVEQKFSVPLRAMDVPKSTSRRGTHVWAMSEGTTDTELLDIDSNQVVLVEDKTTTGRADAYDARFDVDPQPRQYVHSLRMRGHENVGRVIYNVVSKTVPRSPEVNQNGQVSVAKCDTTQRLYEASLVAQEIERNIPRTEKQVTFLRTLPTSTERWAQRYEFFLSERDIEEWRQEIVAESTLVRKARNGKLAITRNGASCSMPWAPPCSMRGVCVDFDARRGDYETAAEAAARADGSAIENDESLGALLGW